MLKIGEEVYVHGYIDEIRNETIIIRNSGGYFGTEPKEVLPLKQPWIPCSKRMPEEDVDVLIAYRYKDDEGDTSHTYIDITSYGDFSFGGRKLEGYKYWRPPFAYFENNYKVVAWMPLPESYKEDEHDE